MKPRSDYVKDFQAAWNDPKTIKEQCWGTDKHDRHLWRRVRSEAFPDADETMRKCEGCCTHELPTDQCAICLKQDEPEKPLTFEGLVKPSSHFHAEGNDAKDL